LWLLRVAYVGKDVDARPLLDDRAFPDSETMRTHLFDRLVAASIAARPPSDRPGDLFRPRRRYERADAERWLRFLAANLDRWDSSDLDWTQDVRDLSATSEGPGRAATVLSDRLTSLLRLVRPVLRTHRWAQVAGVLGALVAAGLSVWLAARIGGGVAGAISDLRWVRSGAQAVAGLVALLATGFCALWLGFTVAQPDEDFEAGIQEDLHGFETDLDRLLTSLLAGSSFGLCHALIAGLAVGVPITLAAGWDTGWRAGLFFALVAGVLAGWRLWRDRWVTPGGGRRLRWYGGSPATELLFGLGVGAIGGLLVGISYEQNAKGGTVAGLALAFAVPAILLFVVLALVVAPVALGVGSAVTALARRVLPSDAPTPGEQGVDSLGLWEAERNAQLLRLLRTAVVLTLLGSVAATGWRALIALPGWSGFSPRALTGWLVSAVDDFDVTVHGGLRYPIAVVLATSVIIMAESWTRRRLQVAWFVTAAAVIAGWTVAGWADPFTVHLAGRFTGGNALFALDGRAALGTGRAEGSTSVSYDLARLAGGAEPRIALLGAAAAVAVLAMIFLVHRLEGGQCRVWWFNQVAALRHARTGRLPRNLMCFLDDGHRLGLLRAVGTVYQFRHAELQNHLAHTDPHQS
jgi:hypothetical protein